MRIVAVLNRVLWGRRVAGPLPTKEGLLYPGDAGNVSTHGSSVCTAIAIVALKQLLLTPL